jgi:DNA-binding MarR family transcriptional regulator
MISQAIALPAAAHPAPRSRPATIDSAAAGTRNSIGMSVVETGRIVRSTPRDFRGGAGTLRNHELQIILELGARGTLRRNALAGLMAVDRAWIGRAARTLQARGIINPSPRRGPLTLSKSGADLLAHLRSSAGMLEASLLCGVQPENREAAEIALVALRQVAVQQLKRKGLNCNPVTEAEALSEDPGAEPLLRSVILAARLIVSVRTGILQRARSLSCAEADTLLIIHDEPAVSLLELTRRLARDKGQLSRVVTTLTAMGLIRFEPLGKRCKGLFVTAEGRAACRWIIDEQQKLDDEYAAALSSEQCRGLSHALALVAANAKRLAVAS